MSELRRLTGVGPKRLQALESSGMRTLRQLVYYLPRRYIDRTRMTPIESLKEGNDAFFAGTVENSQVIGTRLVVSVSDATGQIELVFFRGLNFLQSKFRPGMRLSVAGPVTFFRSLQIAHPEWEILRENEEPLGGVFPVYPMTEVMEASRIEHKLLQKLALEALELFAFSDPLPESERTWLQLQSEMKVLRQLHAPTTMEETQNGLKEMKVRELWPLCLNREKLKKERLTRGRLFPSSAESERAEKALREAFSFQLTLGQENSLKHILTALETPGQFFGLLQGDVGSGKTAVVLMAGVRVMASGAQAAFLVPTEILAEQHFRVMSPLLKIVGLTTALITASTPKEEKLRHLEDLQAGKLSLVVGTHALLSKEVNFQDLRFIVVDEQHRFGVEQRATMINKGHEPHVIFVSATPIPRTLIQSLFGDLEPIILSEKPAGRLPVKTRIVPPEKEKDMLEFLLKEVKSGNQVYWVVPRIEASTPGGALEEKGSIAAVESTFQRLRYYSTQWKVEAVHGRVSAAERERILTSFRQGEVQVLVATTVIEVGVDVPGANIMVVEGTDRFGLAQLHQLRGRTGRGQAQAWCFLLLPPSGFAEESLERLRQFSATEDGFRIAEIDLKNRGSGHLEGLEQSGFNGLHFSNLLEDAELFAELGLKAKKWIE